ncbi:MAG: hypothetical protein U0805_04160 [Pirellulales bacterium]
MRVAFLYNRSAEDPAGAAEDEFPARSPVVAALQRLGHQVLPIACTLDFARVKRRLERVRADVVFNRVESLGGSDSMMAAITLLLDAMQLPYTGNSTAALVAAASKIAVKKRLVAAGMPTPAWITADFQSPNGLNSCYVRPYSFHARYILKSDLEHASFGIDDTSIVGPVDANELQRLIRNRNRSTGRTYFAEEFIAGREFNISIIGSPPRVLPPAEIDFSAFPSDKPRIVSHGAKWNEASFEYHNTPRRFDFPDSDRQLLSRLAELTLECWRLFELCGYARVDFRCDADKRPFILEINTNPCIAPDAGFAAALKQAGASYEEGLQCILNDGIERRFVTKLDDATSTARAALERPPITATYGFH